MSCLVRDENVGYLSSMHALKASKYPALSSNESTFLYNRGNNGISGNVHLTINSVFQNRKIF